MMVSYAETRNAVAVFLPFLLISVASFASAAPLSFVNLLDSATLTGGVYTVTPTTFTGPTALLANLSATASAGGGHSLVLRLSTFDPDANVVVILPADGPTSLTVEQNKFVRATLVVLSPTSPTTSATRSIYVTGNQFASVFPSASGIIETALLRDTLSLPSSLATAPFMLQVSGSAATTTIDVCNNQFRVHANGTMDDDVQSPTLAGASMQVSGSSSTKLNVSQNAVSIVLSDGAGDVEGLSVSGVSGGWHNCAIRIEQNTQTVFAVAPTSPKNTFAPAPDLTVGAIAGIAFSRLSWSTDTTWNISANTFNFTTAVSGGGQAGSVTVQSPDISGVVLQSHNTSGMNLTVWVCDNTAIVDPPTGSVVSNVRGIELDVAFIELIIADGPSSSTMLTSPPYLRVQRNTLTTVGGGVQRAIGISVGRAASTLTLVGGGYLLFEDNIVTVPQAQLSAEGISFALASSMTLAQYMTVWARTNTFNLSSATGNVSGVRFPPSLSSVVGSVMLTDNLYTLSAPRAIAVDFGNVSLTGPALQLTSLSLRNQTVNFIKVSGGSTALRIRTLVVAASASVLLVTSTVNVLSYQLVVSSTSSGVSPQQAPLALNEDVNLISSISIDDCELTEGEEGQSRIAIISWTTQFFAGRNPPAGPIHILPMNPVSATFFRGISFNSVIRSQSYGYLQVTNAVVRFIADNNTVPGLVALTPPTAGLHIDTLYLTNQSRFLIRNLTVLREAEVDSTDVIGVSLGQASGRDLSVLSLSDVTVKVAASTAAWINPSAYGFHFGALAFRFQSTIAVRDVRVVATAARAYGMTFGIVAVSSTSTFTMQRVTIESYAIAKSAGLQLLYLDYADGSNITLDAVSVVTSATTAEIENNNGLEVQVLTGANGGQCRIQNSVVAATGTSLRLVYGRMTQGAVFATSNNTLMSTANVFCNADTDLSPAEAFAIDCTGVVGPPPITLEPQPTSSAPPAAGRGERDLSQEEIAMVAGITGGAFVFVVLVVAGVFLGVRAIRHRRRVSEVEPVNVTREPIDTKSVASMQDVECEVVVVVGNEADHHQQSANEGRM